MGKRLKSDGDGKTRKGRPLQKWMDSKHELKKKGRRSARPGCLEATGQQHIIGSSRDPSPRPLDW